MNNSCRTNSSKGKILVIALLVSINSSIFCIRRVLPAAAVLNVPVEEGAASSSAQRQHPLEIASNHSNKDHKEDERPRFCEFDGESVSQNTSNIFKINRYHTTQYTYVPDVPDKKCVIVDQCCPRFVLQHTQRHYIIAPLTFQNDLLVSVYRRPTYTYLPHLLHHCLLLLLRVDAKNKQFQQQPVLQIIISAPEIKTCMALLGRFPNGLSDNETHNIPLQYLLHPQSSPPLRLFGLLPLGKTK